MHLAGCEPVHHLERLAAIDGCGHPKTVETQVSQIACGTVDPIAWHLEHPVSELDGEERAQVRVLTTEVFAKLL